MLEVIYFEQILIKIQMGVHGSMCIFIIFLIAVNLTRYFDSLVWQFIFLIWNLLINKINVFINEKHMSTSTDFK